MTLEYDEARYIPIIDNILRVSDLTKISSKRVRRGLEAELGYDVSAQKAEIDDLIAKRFDIVLEEQGNTPVNGDADTKSNGTSVKGENETDLEATPSKPKKRKASTEDDDRRLAAKLQAEWNAERRPSRTAAPKRKSAPVRKKKKSSKNASDSDDTGEKKKRKINKNNPFHAPMTLSPALSEVLHETQLSRPETVKSIWKYIKEHGLQDQSDKRYINCDDALKSIFHSDKVHMFTMNKILSTHLYPADPSTKQEKTEEPVQFDEAQNGISNDDLESLF